MKVVVVHNFYQQPGGEDQVFADEVKLLQSRGVQVVTHTAHNDAVTGMTRLTLAGKTIWNRAAADAIAKVVQTERPDVVHVHNTFPLLSPSIFSAARESGAAVVLTLHNYRLICPSGICYRDGHVCEDCVGRPVPWPAVLHKCYRQDRQASAVAATMLAVHRARGTFDRDVDAIIALTQFAKDTLTRGGVPGDKLHVKPNFVSPDPGVGAGRGGYALFVGRLTESKGIRTLLSAWAGLDIPLKIVGDGDLKSEVFAAAKGPIEYLGRRPADEVQRLMGDAAALIFPSVWYEGLPKTILESFAKGTPVIASRLGSMAELITPGINGELFTPGDPGDLAAVVRRSWSTNALDRLRAGARAQYESRYTADVNYDRLMSVYATAMQHRGPAPDRRVFTCGLAPTRG